MINMNLRMQTQKNQTIRNPKLFKVNQTLKYIIYSKKKKKKKFLMPKRMETLKKIEHAKACEAPLLLDHQYKC